MFPKKLIVHTHTKNKNINTILSFTDSYIDQNLYLISSVEHKISYLLECRCCAFLYNDKEQRQKWQGSKKQHKNTCKGLK